MAKNKYSTSKFFNIGYNFKNTKNIERNNLHVRNNILCLDLSSFYHTLYTHSIEWMIHGKDLSKTTKNSKLKSSNYNNDEYVGKALDNLIQKCQFDETHGIPTGNMVSQIVAEIYMCKFDEKLLNRGFNHFSRYVDDIKYSFANDEDKNSFLMNFHDICIEHGLTVNGEKTKEISFSKLRLDDKSYLISLIN